jgi:hypothetical protein
MVAPPKSFEFLAGEAALAKNSLRKHQPSFEFLAGEAAFAEIRRIHCYKLTPTVPGVNCHVMFYYIKRDATFFDCFRFR